jgi:hypothetical protein
MDTKEGADMSSEETGEVGGLDKIQSSLKEIQEFLLQSKNRQRKLRWWSHGLTAAIIIVFAIYIVLFYQTLRENLSAEKFAESIQIHMAEMAPIITDASLEVLTQVSPVYLELARKKADALTPRLMDGLEQNVDIFITNMSNFTQKEFQGRLDVIVKQLADEFRKAFPGLTDEQIDRFIDQTEMDIQTAFIEGTEHILNRSFPEITQLKSLVQQLEDKNMPKENIELTRLLLHNLLVLLDKEIMEGFAHGK